METRNVSACGFCGEVVTFPCETMCEIHDCENLKNAPLNALKPEFLDKPVDTVMHPPHYAQWAMEPIEFIAINDLSWWQANVIKYTMRYKMKDGLKDLYKARSYLDMKIRHLEGHVRFWDKPVSEERQL